MLDPDAPNSTSTLTNGVTIFIQIIQKNNRYSKLNITIYFIYLFNLIFIQESN